MLICLCVAVVVVVVVVVIVVRYRAWLCDQCSLPPEAEMVPFTLCIIS